MKTREKLRDYLNPRCYRRKTLIALIALVYASFLIAALSFHLSIYIRGHYGTVVYQVWVFFYYFTFQTNITIAIWLFLYAITTLTGSKSRFARFIKHPLLLASFTLYVSILFIYASTFVLTNIIDDGFNSTRNGFAIFTYLLTPIAIWTIFLFENNRIYAKRKKLPKHERLKLIGSYNSKKIIQKLNKQPKALRYRDTVWFLVYPTIYFALNTVVGHIAIKAKERIYEDGVWTVVYGRAFAYPQLDPHFWSNVGTYAGFIIGTALFFTSISILIVSIKKLQYRHIRKRAIGCKTQKSTETINESTT